MLISGIKGTSLIDYPGKVAAVLYTSRCNFRCPFCHNKQLVINTDINLLPEEKMLGMLDSRRGFIDGVVITGGEPTVHPDLYELITVIKKQGFAIKLDTNGSHPEILEKLLANKKLDYIAMDLKTSWEKYSKASGVVLDFHSLLRSVTLIQASGIDHEFRTTCVPTLVEENDILEISKLVGLGSSYTLQQFQPSKYAGTLPFPA